VVRRLRKANVLRESAVVSGAYVSYIRLLGTLPDQIKVYTVPAHPRSWLFDIENRLLSIDGIHLAHLCRVHHLKGRSRAVVDR
jgi:hypothetical protein